MAKKKSEAEKQITKELRRIRAGILRAQKRGYFFDKDPVKTLTKKAFSYKKPETIAKHLRQITPKDIYKIAYHATSESDRAIFVKGTKYRGIERKEQAQKAAESRKANEARREWAKEHGVEATNVAADEASAIINNVMRDTANETSTGLDTTSFADETIRVLKNTPFDSTRTKNFNEWKRITRNKGIEYILDAISDLGADTVARNLEKHAVEIRELVDRLIYDSYKGEGDVGAKRDLTRLIQIMHGGNITDAEVKDLS